MREELEEIVEKFRENPVYVSNGAGFLAKRWGYSKEDIKDARKLFRAEKLQDVVHKREHKPVKRLFFDIETSYNIVRSWGIHKVFLHHENIVKERAVICISYKWEGEDKVYNLSWDKNQNDRDMLIKFLEVVEKADEVVGHNSDRFDIPWLATRCLYHRIPFPSKFRSMDTLKKVRAQFRFNSNRLDYIGRFLGVGQKQDTGGFSLWVKVIEDKNPKAMKEMLNYCDQDVILLEDVFSVIKGYIKPVTNHAALKGLPKWACGMCDSKNVKLRKASATPLGTIRRHMVCKDCGCQYDTSNKTYIDFLKNGNF